MPDTNPPAASTLGVPCLADFSAPVAAANLLAFWDSQNHGPYGHWNAGGVTGGPLQPYPGSEVAQYLSWFMATNSRRNAACATVASDTWGRTNARTGATAGTRQSDFVPGLIEYVRWDSAFHPFAGGISQPPLPARKAGYDWRLKTVLAPSLPPDTRQFVYDATRYFPGQPLLATFRHWHLTYLCTEYGVEYYDWLPPVSGTNDPAYAPNYSGGGTPPAEQWNGENLGHTVVVIDAQYRSACSTPPRDWFVVRDGIPNTGTNVAVPFFYDQAFDFKTWLTSYSVVEDAVIEPDLAIDAAGHRHVVWGGGPMNTPEQQIFYAGNAAPGALAGTFVDYGTDPAIAIDPNTGHLTVAFTTGGVYGVRSTTNALGSWSSEDINSSSPPLPRNPTIAIDSQSNGHVIWQAGCDELDGCPWADVRLYWSDRPAGGSWGPTQELFDIDDPDVSPELISPNRDPDLAIHGSDAYLVYDHGHQEIELVTGTISAGQITWDPGSLQTVNVATGDPVGAPKIAVDDDGDVYVVWSDRRSGVWQTYHQTRRAGTWLDADRAVSSATTSATEPDIAVRSTPTETQVYVTWEEERPAGNYEIASATLVASANGLFYPGAAVNRSASSAPSRSPAVAYNAALNQVDIAWADQSVTLLPEPGVPALIAGIVALLALDRRRTAAI